MVKEAEAHVGMKHPITPDDLMKKLVASACLKNIIPIALTPGNLVLFFTRDGPQHLALVTEPGVILHAAQVKKKVVEHLIPSNWRAAAEFQLVGIED